MSSREAFWQAQLIPRATRLKKLLLDYRPRVVVFFDQSVPAIVTVWKAICPPSAAFRPFQIAGNQDCKIALHDGRIYVLCAHPATRDLSPNYFSAVGRKIRALDRSLSLP